MADPQFRWSPETRLHVSGGAAPIRALREAIREGGEFTVSPAGIAPHARGVAGYFRTRSAGTTGAAKTIRRSHASWIASFEVNRAHLDLGAADRYGVLGDPVHSLALYAIVEAAHLGADLDCLAGMRPDRQARHLAEAGVSILYATPTQLLGLCAPGLPLPALRHILCGGGRLPEGLRARVEALCPNATMREFYGAAETSFIAWGDGSGPPGSVGRPYPGAEVRIGPSGEIWVRSPYLFDGYAEGDSPHTRRENGFVTVGEMGGIDPDGFLTVAGRRSRMVTVADQNVFPEEIEAFLLGDPSVAHCAVVPRADPLRGNVLIAVIPGPLDGATRDRLMARCRAAFGPLAAPREIVTP
uniref:AMP-binding protein n=1 Tax=Salipiger sp. TaxID=2078585 RepID=UPI003A976985